MEDNALYAFHNHEVTGSIPVPATTRIKAFKNTLFLDAFFYICFVWSRSWSCILNVCSAGTLEKT